MGGVQAYVGKKKEMCETTGVAHYRRFPGRYWEKEGVPSAIERES